MGSRTDIQAGRAFVELYLKNSLTKGLNAASKHLKQFGGGVSSIGQTFMRIGSLATTAGAAMSAAFIAPIKAAGDLMETTSKFNSVFAENADGVRKWMDEYRNQIGRGAKESMDGLSAFGAFFQGMGKGGDEAADLSKKLLELSMDFASFHNLADTEAQERFISALSGSSQVLDMFGINIKQSALDLKLLEMGFPSVAKGADETQKVMARMAIISESMGRQGALGDATKTAGSFSNQMKRLRGSLMDSAATIGNALLPVVTPFVTKASELIGLFGKWASENQGVIQSVFKGVLAFTAASAAVVAFGAAFVGAGAVLSTIGTVLGGLAAGLGFVLSPLGLITVGLGAGVTAWALWTESGQSAVGAVGELFTGLMGTFKDTWSSIVTAISSGDLALAGKVAMAGLNVAWVQIKAAALKVWHEIKFSFVSTWQTAVTELAKSFVDLWAGVRSGFVNAAAGIMSVWDQVKRAIFDAADVAAKMQEDSAVALAKKTGAITTPEQEQELRKKIRTKPVEDAYAAGYITKEQRDKAVADLGRSAEDRIGERQNKSIAEQQNIETARKQALAKIEADRAGASGMLDQDKQRGLDALKQQHNAALAAAQADLETARAALRQRRMEIEAKKKLDINLIDDAETAAQDRIKNPEKKIEAGGSFGSFSAAALLGATGGKTPQERMVAEQRRLREEAAKAEIQRRKDMQKLKTAVENNQVEVLT